MSVERLEAAVRDLLREEIAAMTAYVTASPSARPDEPVLIPGDPERLTRADRIAHGVPIAVDGESLSVVPLLLTAFAGWRLVRAGVHVSRTRQPRSVRAALGTAGMVAAAYGVLGTVAAAFTRDGELTALRFKNVANMGAFIRAPAGPCCSAYATGSLSGSSACAAYTYAGVAGGAPR